MNHTTGIEYIDSGLSKVNGIADKKELKDLADMTSNFITRVRGMSYGNSQEVLMGARLVPHKSGTRHSHRKSSMRVAE